MLIVYTCNNALGVERQRYFIPM